MFDPGVYTLLGFSQFEKKRSETRMEGIGLSRVVFTVFMVTCCLMLRATPRQCDATLKEHGHSA